MRRRVASSASAFATSPRARSSSATGSRLLWGPNGAGKTNLLEATLPRRSPAAPAGPATSARRSPSASRSPAPRSTVATAASARRFLCSLEPRRGPPPPASTARRPAAERGELRPPLAVFMPDRLALVKGPPAGAPRAPGPLLRRALAGARGGPRRATAGRSRSATRCSAGSAPAPPRRAIARRLGPGAGGRGRRADRDPRRGGRAAGAGVRRGRRRRSASPARPSCATGRAATATDAEELAAELAERREADLAPRLHGLRARISTSSRSSSPAAPLRRYGSQGQQRAGAAGAAVRRARRAARRRAGRRR